MKLYKAFALITLASAPVIVLITQSVTPQPQQAFSPATAATTVPAPSSAPAPTTQPMPAIMESVADPASFSQPFPEAGKPFLAPGAGLPGDPLPETPPGSNEAEEMLSEN